MLPHGFKHDDRVQYTGPSLFQSGAKWKGKVVVKTQIPDIYRSDRVLVQVGSEKRLRQAKPEHLKRIR